MILHVLIAMVAGWVQRHQQQVITYTLSDTAAVRCGAMLVPSGAVLATAGAVGMLSSAQFGPSPM